MQLLFFQGILVCSFNMQCPSRCCHIRLKSPSGNYHVLFVYLKELGRKPFQNLACHITYPSDTGHHHKMVSCVWCAVSEVGNLLHEKLYYIKIPDLLLQEMPSPAHSIFRLTPCGWKVPSDRKLEKIEFSFLPYPTRVVLVWGNTIR